MYHVVHENRSGVLWWRDVGFFHLRPHGGYEASASDIEDMARHLVAFVSARVEEPLSGSGFEALPKAALLIDRTNSYVPSFDAWLAFQKQAPMLFTAIAYFAPSSYAYEASTYERDFFLEKRLPVAIFTTMDAAEGWLRSYAAS